MKEGRTREISVNPLTGDLVGVFSSERRSTSTSNGGSNEDLSSNCSIASMSTTSSINSSKESSPMPSAFSTPIKNRFVRVGRPQLEELVAFSSNQKLKHSLFRIPPGGYSTPLW